jgi:hypothetical protein
MELLVISAFCGHCYAVLFYVSGICSVEYLVVGEVGGFKWNDSLKQN